MKAAKILKKHNIAAEIHHTNIAEAKSIGTNYNAIICAENFSESFNIIAAKGVKIISLQNLMSENELEDKLISAGIITIR